MLQVERVALEFWGNNIYWLVSHILLVKHDGFRDNIMFVFVLSEIIPSPETRQAINDTPISQNASVSMPMCENSSISQDSFLEVDVSGGKQTNVAAPRGILKHLSASSSTDSLPSCLELQYPCSLDSPTDTLIDRKQVRFSTAVSQSGVKWQDGKEVGEHSLLDTDSSAPENASDLEKAGSSTSGTHKPLLKQSQVDSQEGEPGCKYEANIQEQEAGQHLVFGGKNST